MTRIEANREFRLFYEAPVLSLTSQLLSQPLHTREKSANYQFLIPSVGYRAYQREVVCRLQF